MFVNKDYPTEWALNPSNYRNMDNDQVDWAALAQEWIKMKETSIPSAPTPPSISENPSFGGGGEAPMDMEFKDDEIPPAPPAPNISGTNNWNRWDQQWSSAGNWNPMGNWDWNSPEASVTRIPNNMMIPPPAPVISATPAFLDHGTLGSTAPLESPSSSPSFGYNTMTLPRSHFSNQVPNSGFWNNEQQQHPHAPGTSSLPFLKDVRPARIPPSSVTSLPTLDMTLRNRDVKEATPENDSLSTIDTNKRKQLPAWIREGLEKMEREKQKAIERERQAVLRKQELEACKKIKDQARAVLSPEKSKFDSDSEKELPECELKDNSQDDASKLQNCEQGSPDVTKPRKTRFRDASSPEKLVNPVPLPNPVVKSPTASTAPACVNKEELLQSLMLQVRRSLTEILLEVTNDEIISTCEQVWKNVHNKGKIVPTLSASTAPVAQITRRLGLGVYSDSDSESSDENSSQNQSEKSMINRNDSDEELKETVRLRQQAFKKTEAEIEASLAEEEKDQLAQNKRTEVLSDRRDRMMGNDRNKHKIGHAAQESNKNWKEDRDNEKSSVGHRKFSLHIDDEGPPSDAMAPKSRNTPDRFKQEEEFSSGESGNQSFSSTKRKASHGSNNGKSKRSSSPRKRNARRASDDARRCSSSRSRSRSKNGSSSRDDSRESSCSKLGAVPDKTVKQCKSERYKSGLEFSKKCASLEQYGKPRSRSTSQSDAQSRSRSRSRSNSTVRSRHKRSRSRSCTSFRRQDRNRNNRSRYRSRSQSQSRSRSTSRSRSKSRSRKRSKSSYKNNKSEGAKRRSSRSRSTERSRRSRSSTRKSKSSHRQRQHRYERDRKKSTRHHVD